MDIVGANLYNRFIKRNSLNVLNGNMITKDDGITSTTSSTSNGACILPSSRKIPQNAELSEQTVEDCLSMLVGTGVYKYGTEMNSKGPDGQVVYHGHRDIAHEPELTQPHKFVQDVNEGIEYILEREALPSA